MAVNGIGQYDLFKQYSQNIDHNRIQINNHEKISALEPSIKDVKSNDVRQHEAEETLSPAQNRRLDSRTRASELEDISLNFNKNEEKSLLGKDSNLADLDVEKAISDMRKDSILEQYQYFVGDKGTTLVNNEDGVVFQKFDQALTMM